MPRIKCWLSACIAQAPAIILCVLSGVTIIAVYWAMFGIPTTATTVADKWLTQSVCLYVAGILCVIWARLVWSFKQQAPPGCEEFDRSIGLAWLTAAFSILYATYKLAEALRYLNSVGG